MPNALDIYGGLTQVMDEVVRPRYQKTLFENGDLIPTIGNLLPGIKEIAIPKIQEVGGADIASDAASNIKLIYITTDYDRYPVYMFMSGFGVTFQESRSFGRTDLDGIKPRMALARLAIAQETNIATAIGRANVNFPGVLTNSLVQADNSAVNIYTSTFDQVLDFFTQTIRSLTRNYITSDPTDMVVSFDVMTRIMSLKNSLGTSSVYQELKALFPRLLISEAPQTEAAVIDASGITRPGVGKDRLLLYVKEPTVLSRKIEKKIAELAPEEFVSTATIAGQLTRIYPLFSCATPAVINYPQDVRYIDLPVKS